MIRPWVRTKGTKDEIDEVLGSPFYAQNYYFKQLKEMILGPYSTDLIGVSRYYLRCTPEVVVDFEPQPLDGKFYIDEKRKFFMEQGIVYVPIFLKERLQKEAFAERVKQESGAMREAHMAALENAKLRTVDVEEMLTDPEVIRAIDAEALRRMDERPNVRGIARVSALVKVKQKVTAELRQKAKSGRLGRGFSREQLALAAG